MNALEHLLTACETVTRMGTTLTGIEITE